MQPGEVRLHGVERWSPPYARVTINKPDILFVFTTDQSTRPRPSGLVVEKQPLAVGLYVGPYHIRGAFHVLEPIPSQEWLIGQRVPFLPMTNVSVALAAEEAETSVPFLAVNRQHIGLLYET